jgi:hypothetical protein
MITTYKDPFEFDWRTELEWMEPHDVERTLDDESEVLTDNELQIFASHCSDEIRDHSRAACPKRKEIAQWKRIRREVLRQLAERRANAAKEDRADVASDDSQRHGASA